MIVKATGIVRRLDDLGRLVIPKEIRKLHHLKEGDSIEFFVESDQIIIKKYEVLSKHLENLNMMVDALEDIYQESVLFIQDEWLKYHDLSIDPSFCEKAKSHHITMFEDALLYEDDDHTYNGVIYPVILFGDWFGSFVLLFERHRYKEEDLRPFEAYSELLSRQQLR